MDYPYEKQNCKGRAYQIGPNGKKIYVDPGYTRTITNSRKEIKGVSHHPFQDAKRHVRADEVRVPRRPR